jgi:predicted GNAT family acetyltransferase
MPFTVIHNAAAMRFEVVLHGQVAVCSYRRQADVLVLTHTEVPAALQGQGMAAALVQAALDWARGQGLRVRPRCSYVSSYMRRHALTQDLLESPGEFT